jgi:PIN domain nuclease of toxin-antitoxin system
MLETSASEAEPVGVSTITLWEIAMLVARGRLPLLGSVDAFLADVESHPVVQMLPITARVAVESTRLGSTYSRDPVDRIIGATARCYGLRLMTADQNIRKSAMIALA